MQPTVRYLVQSLKVEKNSLSVNGGHWKLLDSIRVHPRVSDGLVVPSDRAELSRKKRWIEERIDMGFKTVCMPDNLSFLFIKIEL